MFVRDNMTKDPVCITPDQTISQVVDLMSEKKLHRLPVVQGKRIVGLVTEGTISASGASKATSLSIYELNYLLSKTTVDTIMIRNVVTIQEDALMEDAAMTMLKNDIGCLPVVDANGEISGILTQNDVFNACLAHIAAKIGYFFRIESAVIENYYRLGVGDLLADFLDLRSLCLNVLSICHGFTSYKN